MARGIENIILIVIMILWMADVIGQETGALILGGAAIIEIIAHRDELTGE